MTILMRVDGPRVRQLRIDTWMSQAELAKKAGVRRETVVNMEHGRTARRESVLSVAAALGVDPRDFAAAED